MKKQILAGLLALVLVLTLLPTAAFAAGGDLPFTDVTPSDSFYSSIRYVYEKGVFKGVSADQFSPYASTTRAMLVTVLHRLEGEPTPTKEADFADVTSDSWYAASAAWSAEMGIVAGTENGFDGNRPITRQDLALMLYRYANVYGSGKGTSTDFTHMGGAEDVADYAAEAMSWAVGSGIIVGDENNNLDPQSPTTRAQVSVMLMRFVELLAAK